MTAPSAAGTRIHPTAEVEDGSRVGAGTTVWQFAHVRHGARVGEGCTLGRGAFVDEDVVLGDRVKVQNHALIYRPARLGDGVFVGPAVVLTNDLHPRAVTVEGAPKGVDDWDAVGVVLDEGCSIGARTVLLPGVHVGRWAMVGAGSVVTRDVPPFALVAGTPARRRGWVGRAGHRLEDLGGGRYRCPATAESYVEDAAGRLAPAAG
ncbi:acyltransferase [Actinomycetospora lutea]|uniref:acyltransferase n=1 Tax=Actinomycetospora lutea TaxID=663604 RepID=UPI002365E657|nr:acyltransferase [Actinomycetospora lutea]MDD7941998.1 acyltransferase [Actinomycetospora lutea]